MPSLGVMLVTALVAAGPQSQTTAAEPTPKEVREAISRSLPFLEKEGMAWMETRSCTSCHHVPMMLWTHHEASSRGFSVNTGAADEAEAWAIGQYLGHPDLQPTVQDKNFPKRGPGPGAVYLALGVNAAERRDDKAADASKKLSAHFAKMQEPDGSWALKQSTAPLVDGDDVATALILLALDPSQPSDDTLKTATRKSLRWLDQTPSRHETQPLALRGMVAARYGNPEQAKSFANLLRARQNEDGGWSQIDGRPSDALATGQALCALIAANEPRDGAPVHRAWKFLLDSQQPDGSWAVKTRHPKGHDEIVTYYGTGWATLGLLRSLPD